MKDRNPREFFDGSKKISTFKGCRSTPVHFEILWMRGKITRRKSFEISIRNQISQFSAKLPMKFDELYISRDIEESQSAILQLE